MDRMLQSKTAVLLAAVSIAAVLPVEMGAQEKPSPVRAAIRQTAVVSNVPPGTGKLRVWMALPRDERVQVLEEVKLTGGTSREVKSSALSGARFAYFEVDQPMSQAVLAAEYIFERRPVTAIEDIAAAARMTEPVNERSVRFYANELKVETGVPLNPTFGGLAKAIVKGETNPVLQARLLYEWVTSNIQPAPPTQSRPPIAGAEECLKDRTGSSFEMHALFASLARSVQLPVRLVAGRELNPFVGLQRWWIEFQALGIGWIPLDVYAGASAPPMERLKFFGRLDAARIAVGMGRDITLEPKSAATAVTGFYDVYVEADGKPHVSYRSTFVAAPATGKTP